MYDPLLHAEANLGCNLYVMYILHVVALSEKHGVFLMIRLPADQTGIHDALIYQRQETPVSVPWGLFIEIKVRREPGDLFMQRL